MVTKKPFMGFPIWQRILVGFTEGESVYRNCRNLDLQYHISYFKEMERRGWIRLVKKGRKYSVLLTPVGKQLRESIRILSVSVKQSGN